jgi:hypothetical protein
MVTFRLRKLANLLNECERLLEASVREPAQTILTQGSLFP